MCPGSSQTSRRSGDKAGPCIQPLEGPLGTMGGTFLGWLAAAKILKTFLAILGLPCSSCREQGLTLRCRARASHRGGFPCCGAQALGAWASVVGAHRLSSCGFPALEPWLRSHGSWSSCSAAVRIVLDQGSNLCSLHWQADSYPLLPGKSERGLF